MKQSTLNNIKQAVNQLIKNNIRLTTEVLSKEAHTSKRTVTEFFKMFPKESFNKYYKNGTAYDGTILYNTDENGTIENSTILKQETESGTDSNLTKNGTVQSGTKENDTDTNWKNGTDSNLIKNGTIQNGTKENGTDTNWQNGTEEVYDVMTNEGYVNQLNKLYTKGSIDKEYYNQQVRILKNSYPAAYNSIKEKLMMDV